MLKERVIFMNKLAYMKGYMEKEALVKLVNASTPAMQMIATKLPKSYKLYRNIIAKTMKGIRKPVPLSKQLTGKLRYPGRTKPVREAMKLTAEHPVVAAAGGTAPLLAPLVDPYIGSVIAGTPFLSPALALGSTAAYSKANKVLAKNPALTEALFRAGKLF
jgi:hypothetical protein